MPASRPVLFIFWAANPPDDSGEPVTPPGTKKAAGKWAAFQLFALASGRVVFIFWVAKKRTQKATGELEDIGLAIDLP